MNHYRLYVDKLGADNRVEQRLVRVDLVELPNDEFSYRTRKNGKKPCIKLVSRHQAEMFIKDMVDGEVVSSATAND